MAEAAALAYFALPSAAGGDEGPAAVAAEARTAAAIRATTTEAFIATPGREIDQQHSYQRALPLAGLASLASCVASVAMMSLYCSLVASCQLPVASCQLPVASCQLPVASCQQPSSSTWN